MSAPVVRMSYLAFRFVNVNRIQHARTRFNVLNSPSSININYLYLILGYHMFELCLYFKKVSGMEIFFVVFLTYVFLEVVTLLIHGLVTIVD